MIYRLPGVALKEFFNVHFFELLVVRVVFLLVCFPNRVNGQLKTLIGKKAVK